MMRAAAVLALCCVLLLQGRAGAEPEPESLYAPMPADIEAVIVSENDRALAKYALATLERRDPGVETARAQLVLLGDAGLRSVARRLARRSVPPRLLPDLLHVVASSAHRDADILLERAGRERRPFLRMIAADGLGHGRTPRAVPALERLARDEVPGVRIAALRSLFAIESPQARAARAQVPPDQEPDLLAARLRWHRRAEDAWPALLEIATRAYERGDSVALRVAAADLLTLPSLRTPHPLLLDVVRETGTNALAARLFRMGRGLPRNGYDEVEMRGVAIRAALTLLERKDLPADERRRLIARAVWWVARPVEMDSYRKDPIPEDRLRRRLPDLGAEIVEPVVALLEAGRFANPRTGALLLRAVGAQAALPVLRSLVRPAALPPLASRAERGRQEDVRVAAAGAVQEIGRLEDEALARALIFGNDRQSLRIDALRALADDPGAWVVPLLHEVTHLENRELRSWALDILEKRTEPEARRILVADLFERVERPEQRMRPLVGRGDAASFALLERALKDDRSLIRTAALKQFRRALNPRICGEEGKRLLNGFRPALRSEYQVQEYIYALLAVDPLSAVRYVRDTWDQFGRDRTRQTSLRQLQETRGKQARRAAIDLALLHAGPEQPTTMLLTVSAVLKGYWSYRPKEVAAFWRRLLTSPNASLRWQAIGALHVEGGPDMTDVLLPLLAKARDRKALGDDSDHTEEQALAEAILNALRHQPWETVESVIVDAATDPYAAIPTRTVAAQMLLGRLSDGARERLLRWLKDTSEAGGVQLYLAASVGLGASPAQAAALQAMLKKEVLSFYSNERLARLATESLAAIDAGAPRARALALARAVAHTAHEPTIVGLLDLVFDLRFARYARTSVQRQRETLVVAGADAAARVPSTIRALAHGDDQRLFGMPGALYEAMSQVKVLEDEKLAAALARVLSAARADGRLAHFPRLYLYRLYELLREPTGGRKPRSAEVVYGMLRLYAGVDDAVGYYTEHSRVTDLSMTGRFAEAVPAQRRALRILARRGHGDRNAAAWRLQRARLDALRGGLHASRGEAEHARAAYRRAVLHAPNDSDVLNTVAWQRALADFELGRAEAEALRATTLEARVDKQPTLNAADTLAYVLLKLDRPEEAIAVLAPRIMPTTKDGLIFYHLAQMHASAGDLPAAWRAMVQALTWDRKRVDDIASDPHLEAFRQGDRMETLRRAAAKNRRDEGLE